MAKAQFSVIGARWTPLFALLCLIATIGLSIAAAGDNVLPGDVAVSNAIQDAGFSAAERLERIGYFLGGLQGIITVGLPVFALLALTGHFTDALLIAGALFLRATNPYIKSVIESPRPTADLVRIQDDATGNPGSPGFPSGHVMATVLLYVTLIYLAQVLIRPRWLRITIQAVAVVPIIITAWSRIYSGADWPSDVLGGLLWGIFLLMIYWAAVHHREAGEPAEHREDNS